MLKVLIHAMTILRREGSRQNRLGVGYAKSYSMPVSDDQQPPTPEPLATGRPFVLDYQTHAARCPRSVLPLFERVVHLAVCLGLPLVCFGISASHYPAGPEYQSGHWVDYLGLIPTSRVGWPFYPLLLCALAGAIAMIVSPARAAQWFGVRFALYTGIVLAWQFSIIQILCVAKQSGNVLAIAAGVIIPVLAVAAAIFVRWVVGLLADMLTPWIGRVRLWHWLCAIGALATLLTAIASFVGPGAVGIVLVPLMAVLFVAPLLTLSSFVILARLARKLQDKPAEGTSGSKPHRWLWLLSWLGLFSGAWKLAFDRALVEYARLPTTPPDCYIATAATKGHAFLVGSWTTHSAAGAPFLANQQLVRFKAFELLLQVACPRTHRLLRRWYDRWGAWMAGLLVSCLLADLAYLTLKPLEWLAATLLWAAGTRPARTRLIFRRD